jgi:small multidrug resistance family-3 protein
VLDIAAGLRDTRTPILMGEAVLRTGALFVLTAVAEIAGCYLTFLWWRRGATALLLIPAALSLAAFALLLTVHPGPAGRTYAAYGAVYVATAVVWLALVDGQRPDAWDVTGALVALLGMAIIVAGHVRPA